MCYCFVTVHGCLLNVPFSLWCRKAFVPLARRAESRKSRGLTAPSSFVFLVPYFCPLSPDQYQTIKCSLTLLKFLNLHDFKGKLPLTLPMKSSSKMAASSCSELMITDIAKLAPCSEVLRHVVVTICKFQLELQLLYRIATNLKKTNPHRS